MSNQTNTDLLELASEHISYWEGEGIGAVIEADLDKDDLESLSEHLRESARIMYDQEYQPDFCEMCGAVPMTVMCNNAGCDV